MTPSKTLFYFCIAFVIGIALASFVKIPPIFLWGFFIVAIVLLGGSFFKKNAAVVGFCALFFLVGILRFEVAQFVIENDPVQNMNDHIGTITLVGQIIYEPDARDNSQKLKVTIDGTRSVVLITVHRYPEYQYLDELKITGKLKTPPQINDFNYRNYLLKDGVYSVMDYPSIEVISRKHSYTIQTFLYEKILWLKGMLITSLEENFSKPHDSIMKGMVFGSDKTMPKELKEMFTVTGLSHVTAVSGTNIVILINIAVIFLLALGFWRGQAFYVAVAFIWIYIVLIGFPASGVRAAIMGSCVLLAQKLGRQNTGTRILVFTAGLMLIQNPLLLPYDIGFQLSFLASLGIIHIKPILEHVSTVWLFFKRRTEEKNTQTVVGKVTRFFLDILLITISAQIITLPILMYNFDMVSLIAPLTNMLASPVVEVLTILGFLTSIAGSISHILGFIFSLPCWLLLVYFLKVLDIFSQSWAMVTVSDVSLVFVFFYYVILFAVVRIFQRYTRGDLVQY